jgi:hypothetical protein
MNNTELKRFLDARQRDYAIALTGLKAGRNSAVIGFGISSAGSSARLP